MYQQRGLSIHLCSELGGLCELNLDGKVLMNDGSKYEGDVVTYTFPARMASQTRTYRRGAAWK